MCWVPELLDVDVDPVHTEVAGQRDKLADRPWSRAAEFVENASFFADPERPCRRARSARRGGGRPRGSAGPDRAGDPLVAVLARSRGCRSCGGSRRRAPIVVRSVAARWSAIVAVHLPIRHEAVDLVAGHGNRRVGVPAAGRPGTRRRRDVGTLGGAVDGGTGQGDGEPDADRRARPGPPRRRSVGSWVKRAAHRGRRSNGGGSAGAGPAVRRCGGRDALDPNAPIQRRTIGSQTALADSWARTASISNSPGTVSVRAGTAHSIESKPANAARRRF